MLSIIPKEVLASLKSIHKILDIGNTMKKKAAENEEVIEAAGINPASS